MLNLKYIGSEDFYQVDFKSNGKSLVTITGDVPVKRTGFYLYKVGKKDILGDYSSFVTVYKELENGVMYSNDGSVYVEPEQEPEPEPEPYVPTQSEILTSKITELVATCKSLVDEGVVINGEHYTYYSTQRTDLKELFDTVSATGLPIGYENADGVCREHSAEEIINIYVAQLTNKYSQETYRNQAVLYLKSLEESDENKELIKSYEYGTELTDEYLEHYNEMLALYQAQLEALIGSKE